MKFQYIVIAFYVISLLSCGVKEKNQDNQNTLRVRIISNPDNFNPILSFDSQSSEISGYVYQTINSFDEKTSQLKPSLMSLPEILDKGSKYKYKLKENVLFSDGEKLTEKDVIFTFKVIKNPLIKNEYSYLLRNLDSVAYENGFLIVYFNKAKWRNEYNIAGIPILPKHIWDPENLTDDFSFSAILHDTLNENLRKYSTEFASINSKPGNKQFIGSGPYVYGNIVRDTLIDLVLNENYWNKKEDPVNIKKITFLIIPKEEDAIESLKNGKLDFSLVQNVDIFYRMLEDKSKYGLEGVSPIEPSYTYLGWNQKNPIFKDTKTRKALSHLIDIKEILGSAKHEFGVRINSPIFHLNEKYLNKEIKPIEFDTDKAKSLLSEAGWNDTNGDGILDKIIDGKKVKFSFTFTISNSPYRLKYVKFIVETLRKNGINAEIEVLEWNDYLKVYQSGNYDATYSGWQLSMYPPDPYSLWHSDVTTTSINPIHFINKQSDDLIEKYEAEFDETERIKILKEWQKLIYDEQPYSFLYSFNKRYLYSDRFETGGWSDNSSYYDFTKWKLRK